MSADTENVDREPTPGRGRCGTRSGIGVGRWPVECAPDQREGMGPACNQLQGMTPPRTYDRSWCEAAALSAVDR